MLEVSGLTVSFNGTTVVSDIGFSLNRGEVLGFVGESGSGKSITSLALMGLLPPNARITSGRAILTIDNNPIDLIELPETQHRQLRGKTIAMIFQEPHTSLNPSMRCGKQVVEAIELNTSLRGKKAKQRCMELFKEMQLPDPQKVFNSYPHQLSGGQKQRVMIAMALAGEPKLLIADEPTTALDVTVQKEILALLRQVRELHNLAIIFISHDLAVISEIADRIMVMQQGRLVEQGVANNILCSPRHAYTQQLINFRKKINQPISTQNSLDFNKRTIFKVSQAVVNYRGNSWFDKGFRAISNVSFTLYEGETLGLVGESGSGKSTLGRVLLKLLALQSGLVEYEGIPLNCMGHNQLMRFRRQVQLVFQDPYSSLNPRLTIEQALIEPFLYHGMGNRKEARQNMAKLLDAVGLRADSTNRYPHEFSGGQRQRIVIARALMLKPTVLICDEVLSALDVSTQSQMLDLLQELKQNHGLTYVFISHDLSVVRSICNRVVVLRMGQIEEEGAAEDIFDRPQSTYTKSLIVAIPGKFF